jgi:hypothetical protein
MNGPPRERSLTNRRLVASFAALLCLQVIGTPHLSAEGSRMILSLGDDSYITWSDVEARTGAIVKRDLEEFRLFDFSVLVLSNISYGGLPDEVRTGLGEFLGRGGTLLVTGGQQSFGSGGYAETELADLLPLRSSGDDFGYHPYGPTLILQRDHPMFRDVEIPTMGYFNELELNSGAMEIAQYRKAVARTTVLDRSSPSRARVEGGGARLPMPLIAERSTGRGTVVAIAIDMGNPLDTDIWKDRDRFAQNCVEYLLERSGIRPVSMPDRPGQGN